MAREPRYVRDPRAWLLSVEVVDWNTWDLVDGEWSEVASDPPDIGLTISVYFPRSDLPQVQRLVRAAARARPPDPEAEPA
jgi:hypothetical protein